MSSEKTIDSILYFDCYDSMIVSVFASSSIKKFLQNELHRRQLINSSYSLRAFARDLSISYSRLSEIMTLETPISRKTISKISHGLKLTEIENDHILDLNEIQSSKDPIFLREAQIRIRSRRQLSNIKILKHGYQHLLSKWYLLPLVEYVTCVPKLDYSEISKKLKITNVVLTESLIGLEKNGLLSKNVRGDWQKSDELVKIESPVPSSLIRNSHKEFLKLAGEAIEKQDISSRKFMTSIFRIRSQDVMQARKEIELFNQRFIKKYSKEIGATEVFSLQQQFYNLGDL